MVACASDIRIMLSRCRTAMGMPWLSADSCRSFVYTYAQLQHLSRSASVGASLFCEVCNYYQSIGKAHAQALQI